MTNCKILTLLTDCSFGVMVYGSSRNSGQTAFNIRDNYLPCAEKAVILQRDSNLNRSCVFYTFFLLWLSKSKHRNATSRSKRV